MTEKVIELPTSSAELQAEFDALSEDFNKLANKVVAINQKYKEIPGVNRAIANALDRLQEAGSWTSHVPMSIAAADREAAARSV